MSRLTCSALLDKKSLTRNKSHHSDEIKAFQAALIHGKTLLSEYHLEGGSAAAQAKHHSWLIDNLLIFIWNRFTPNNSTILPSLVATGGYARQELSLESDIDILILVPDTSDSFVSTLIESFVQFCWDVNLKIGHSARTIKEVIELSKNDLTIMTNMMETRLLIGADDQFELFQKAIHSLDLWPAEQFFKGKLEEQKQRHLHFGDTAYNLEPNIKESPGGLRDLHMIGWVANRYFGTSNLSELVDHQFLSQSEYRSLIKGRDFLWKLRNGLHQLSGRCEDRLLFDYQRDLAEQLGYKQGKNHLAVEQMMKQYYRTVQELQLLNEILLQHFQEAILADKQPFPMKINPRFQSVGGFLEISTPDVFEQDSSAILEVFYLLQQHPELKGIRASTIRQLRSNLHRIDRKYRHNPKNQRLFLNIFEHQIGLTHALRRMNDYGVLGAFFPEFGKIVGQMQHDLFHIFTVDAHSLFVVGNVRGLVQGNDKLNFPTLRSLIATLNRRERLYLAALCHDVGKGSGKDHSIVGEKIALSFCKRLGLSEYDAKFVAWLVRNHLIMSWTAQREDTSDPHVIDRFSEIVGDQEHLDNLYLLTVTDIIGTSPKVWNEWKGQLLHNLYSATSRRLRSGLRGVEAATQRVRDRKKAIEKILDNEIPIQTLKKFWEQLGQEYFLRNSPENSAWQALQIHNANVTDLPLVKIRHREEIQAQQILVVAPESEILLPKSTGTLEKMNLSILDARIHHTHSGLAILVFITVNRDGQTLEKTALEKQSAHIRKLLLAPQHNYAPSNRILPRAYKQFRVPTSVTFTDDMKNRHTTMEIVSQDRPGLLYHVSMALLECKVKLLSAKVSTVGEKAEDTFFITDRDGNPVQSTEQRKCLEDRLKASLSPVS
ncbi:MAG: [protein-PII] uridylyltransferase [Gammaproteobacteria bacterium]|nr:[protein-PII] uridylyltransferase [Gammaproteobacteria bacterium]